MVENNENINNDAASNAPQPTSPTPAKGEEKMRQDIAQILEEVKIPERKTFTAEADTKPQEQPSLQQKVSTEIGAAATQAHKKNIASVLDAETIPTNTQQQKKSIIRPLHTLKDDLGTIVESNKMSLVKAAALESDKVRPQQERVAEETQRHHTRSRRRTGIVVGIIVLVGIGMLALGAVFLVESQRSIDVAAPASDSLMFAEQTLALSFDDLAPREAKLLLSQAQNQANVTLGSITRIVPIVTDSTPDGEEYERQVTSVEFLETLGSNAPPELLRAMGNDFFLGIHAVDKTVPVMVFTISSYERAFAAMLQWESNISDGLAPFYPAVLQSAQSQGTRLSVIQFEDAVVRNFDARILKDQSGEVQLLYAFPTRNILIIAESPYSFVEALSRLQAERRL